jgi:hypothetical protein
MASLVVVWGSIVYQLIGALDDESSTADDLAPSHVTLSADRPDFVFPDEIRNPFHYRPPRPAKPVSETISPSVKKVWIPPSIKLTGIILTDTRRVAILEDTHGAVHFTSQGDTINGVKIILISNNLVHYEYKGKQSKWVLDQNIVVVP